MSARHLAEGANAGVTQTDRQVCFPVPVTVGRVTHTDVQAVDHCMPETATSSVPYT